MTLSIAAFFEGSGLATESWQLGTTARIFYRVHHVRDGRAALRSQPRGLRAVDEVRLQE